MKKENSTGKLRPPIVVVLGHVDHGKTTLLDTIRKSNIVGKEIGGITQSTGASQIELDIGRKITFIDTPGHSVFSQMRSRGAKLADIAILVVAADDGVKPQTKEALKYINEAKIPLIVAISKIDLPSANTEKVKKQLEGEGVSFEGRGGDVPIILISSKNKKGIAELLEMISLVAEVNNIKGSKNNELEAIVIETNKDKSGPVVSAVILDGTIGVAMEVWAEGVFAKVRGLFNHLGEPIKEAYPGNPVQILGFSQLPEVGAKIISKHVDTISKPAIQKKVDVQNEKKGGIPVVIKAKSEGVLKDLLANIPEGVVVSNFSMGDVVLNDVFAAKSSNIVDQAYPARIFAFQSKVNSAVLKVAETEGVEIERFEIIYKLFERLEELVKSSQEKVLGKAEIIASFPFDNHIVAGCKVIEGRIDRSDKLILSRNKKRLGEIKITSMKKEKDKIDNAKTGEECGIIFTPELDFRVGDVILSVTKLGK